MADALGAVCGMGMSSISRKDIGTTRDLAIDAVTNAIRDSGLEPRDIDGLLLNRSPSAPVKDLPLSIQTELGLTNLKVLTCIDAEGTSAIQMLQYACMSIRTGCAKAVVCVFADSRLSGGGGAGAYANTMPLTGIRDWEAFYGLYGATGPYGLMARRYLWKYGLECEDLGHVAISNRRWAEANPLAQLRKPISMKDYLESRWVVEPFRLLDCAYPVNGAIAVVVTAPETASDLPKVPVYIHGISQGHSGLPAGNAKDEIDAGAQLAAREVFAMSGVGPAEVDICQFYDNFSYVTLRALEDYGLCERGEAAGFVAAGQIGPGGSLPTNTGGGHLSGYYLQGMTPISEAVIQLRGDAGERQVSKRDVALVTGVGGMLNYHAAMIMSGLRSLS